MDIIDEVKKTLYLPVLKVDYRQLKTKKVKLTYEDVFEPYLDNVFLMYYIYGPPVYNPYNKQEVSGYFGMVLYSTIVPIDDFILEGYILLSSYPEKGRGGYISIWIDEELYQYIEMENIPQEAHFFSPIVKKKKNTKKKNIENKYKW